MPHTTPIPARGGRFYEHTALLNPRGECYGWLNKEHAIQYRLKHPQQTVVTYRGRPAMQLPTPIPADPPGFSNRCIFSGSRHYSVHHVIPESGLDIISQVHSFLPIHYLILVSCEAHARIETMVQPLYLPELTKTTAAIDPGRWKQLRDRLHLIKMRNLGQLDQIQEPYLTALLHAQQWNKIEDIPEITGKEDAMVVALRTQRDQEKKAFNSRLAIAHQKYWHQFATQHSFSEINAMFTRPILDMQPKFLHPATMTYWAHKSSAQTNHQQ